MTDIRVEIAIEGEVDPKEQWFTLEPGAVRWADKPIPIYEIYDKKTHLGDAHSIVREDDGRITAMVPEELMMDDEHHGPLVRFGAGFTDIQGDLFESKPPKVTGCLLKEVGRIFIGVGANPGAEIE